jgi:hypothetical protein
MMTNSPQNADCFWLDASIESCQRLLVESWVAFAKELNEACLPKNPPQYTGVHALLLNWADDDLGTDVELVDFQAQLKETLRQRSGRYLVNTRNSSSRRKSWTFWMPTEGRISYWFYTMEVTENMISMSCISGVFGIYRNYKFFFRHWKVILRILRICTTELHDRSIGTYGRRTLH